MRNWLRLFRAQTGVATLLLLLVPFLCDSSVGLLEVVAVAAFALLVHYASFGHNSLMDFVGGYDKTDPGKVHHPLNTGVIQIGTAHLVIHWMLIFSAVVAVGLVFWMSPAPVYALVFMIGWLAFGFAYNDGLSKQSKTGCFAITGSMVSVAGFAWFLSHEAMTEVGALFLTYTYFAIMYQIAWSGFIKEMAQWEPSNVLHWMGARLKRTEDELILLLGPAACFGTYLKFFGLATGMILVATVWSPVEGTIAGILAVVALYLLSGTIQDRKYERQRELQTMSLMEIATIFLPILPMLGVAKGSVLMLATLAYFVLMNRLLWGGWYPKV